MRNWKKISRSPLGPRGNRGCETDRISSDGKRSGRADAELE